jgi:hypothetical protein
MAATSRKPGGTNNVLALFVAFAMVQPMIHESFIHEVGDDPAPRRRVRISGPVYDDSCVPLLRVEYEDGNTELIPPGGIRLFRPLAERARPRVNFGRSPARRRTMRRS